METYGFSSKKSTDPPPRPRAPDLQLAGLVGLAVALLAPIFSGEGLHIVRALTGLAAVLLAVLHFRDRRREFLRDDASWRVHNTEWYLRQSRDWLAYFEKRRQEGAPWYDDDPQDSVKTWDEGVTNWSREVARLELELQGLIDEAGEAARKRAP